MKEQTLDDTVHILVNSKQEALGSSQSMELQYL